MKMFTNYANFHEVLGFLKINSYWFNFLENRNLECIEELLNATSARFAVFPRAAGEDNFLQMFHEVSSGFRKPLNMGDNSFRKLFYYCTSDLIGAVQILYIYIHISGTTQ